MLVFCPALNHITLETATAAAKTAVFFCNGDTTYFFMVNGNSVIEKKME